jgi:hypothetical protein
MDIMDWVAPFACHDYPAGGTPSINSRESTGVSIGKAACGMPSQLQEFGTGMCTGSMFESNTGHGVSVSLCLVLSAP